MSILVVEKSPVLASMFERALRAAGYAGVFVEDAERAVHLLGQRSFELVMMRPDPALENRLRRMGQEVLTTTAQPPTPMTLMLMLARA